MADKKVTQLSDLGNGLDKVDLFHVIDDPAGTPINKKISAEKIFNNVPTWIALKQTAQTVTASGSAQAADLLTAVTLIDATSAIGTISLASATTDGQIKTVLNSSTGGTNAVTITPANFKQGTTVTLNAPGESVTMMYKSSFWYVISGEGHVVA
jgi:mannose-6-phosphate isomerase-like protein (cupin superfamily)